MLAAEKPPAGAASSTVGFGPFTFDRPNGLLREGSREIPLPPRALAVLDLLVSRPGAIVPRQEIIDCVWKEAFVTDTSLAEAISVLRQALGDDPQAPSYIQTVHRRGYRFVAPLSTGPVPLARLEPAPHQPGGIDRQLPSIAWYLAPWTVTLLSTTLAIIAVWQYTHTGEPVSPIVRMRLQPTSGTTFDSRAAAFTLSPDGHVVAWSACDKTCSLYVRRVDQLDPRPLPGTEDASAPFFSPDGRWIGFFASGKLRKVALAGGTPTAIAEAPQPFGAVWMPDGTIVFAASARGGLLRVSDRGGNVETLTTPSADAGEVRHAWPSLAPGGRALLFSIATSPVVGASGRVALMPIGPLAAWQTIVEDADVAQSASQDYIAFSRGSEIHAVAFDRARQAVAGPDTLVVSGIGRGEFAVSRSGALVHATAEDGTSPTLEWMPSAGAAPSPDLAALRRATLTQDGSHLAGIGGTDVWVGDVIRGTLTRLTHEGINVSPAWDPSGTHVYFAARAGGAFEAWVRDSSATSAARRVISAADRHRHVFPTSISRDGLLVAYTESGGATRGDIKVIALKSGAQVASLQTTFDETNGMLSPDGRLLAYQSDESGRWEVSILNLADQRRVPISSSGGTDPIWSNDGSLTFRDGNALMRVAIDSSGATLGSAIKVADLGGAEVAGLMTGDKILIRRSGDSPRQHAVMTLEWARDLRTILGPPTAALTR
jgi:DNA-binding winged helix-turn-helix (wHTH) protein/Tol biopolymer transport system component